MIKKMGSRRLHDRIPFMMHVVSARNVAEASKAFADVGFNIQEVRVMITVLQNQGMTAGELASATCISRSTLSHMLDRLEKSGFLRRQAVDQDGRSLQVHLTEKGMRRARECDEVAVIYENVLLSRITLREQRALYAVLKKILDASGHEVQVEPIVDRGGPRTRVRVKSRRHGSGSSRAIEKSHAKDDGITC